MIGNLAKDDCLDKAVRPTLSNFKNPFGLVKRMILSGNQAAQAALCREILSVVCSPLGLLLSLLEKRNLQILSPSSQPILLLVGPPRSGSSLIYQALAHYLPVSYFRNLNALFPQAPITIECFTKGFYQTRSADFSSFYGKTIGLADPDDGFYIWNRWLGSDRYDVPEKISIHLKADMRRFFSVWATVNRKPLLIKNNRNTAAIRLLNDTLDDIFWIIVERDPLYVAQSLLIAREFVQGDRNIGWGLYSQPSSASTQSPLEAVVDQVYHIYTDIQLQTQALNPEQYIRVSYEAFCLDPSQVVQTIYSRFWKSEPDLPLHTNELLPFSCQNQMKLPIQEFTELQRLINQKFSTISN